MPVDLYAWETMITTWTSCRTARYRVIIRCRLRVTAQGATLRAMANEKLRRIVGHNKPLSRVVIAVGDSVIPHKQINRKSTPKRRGPTTILDIDETGATVKFRSRTSKIARCCVRKRVSSPPATAIGPRDVVEPATPINVEESMDMKPKQMGCEEMPPVEEDPSTLKRTSECSEISGMADYLAKLPTQEPTPAINLYDSM